MSREKKKNPCFRSHILWFEHNYFTKLDWVQKTGIGVKQFVPILSYRPLHTYSRTLSCGMDANLVVDRRWAKYQIKLFTISQLLNLNPCCTYKKLPACKTAKRFLHFWYFAKKSIIVFSHVNTYWLIIFLLNAVIEKKYISLENGTWRRTSGWVNCAEPSRRNKFLANIILQCCVVIPTNRMHRLRIKEPCH